MKQQIIALSLLVCAAAPAMALECQEGFRPFEHSAGEDCIPENPQRIVTLQDQNGLLPLMELGVRPIASAGHINSEGERMYRRMEGYDTTGIEFIGTYGEPDAEAVAAQTPDLIIASPWPEGAYETYSKIAPTIVIDMFSNDLEVALFQFADAVNKTERAEQLQAEFEAKAEAVRNQLDGKLEQTTLSVITSAYQAPGFYGVEPTQAWGTVRRALEPTMTAPEQSWDTERNVKSMEALGDHSADVMFFMAFDADEGGDSDDYGDFIAQPLVQALPVAQADQLVMLDGSAMVGSAWGKAMNGLDQIATVLLRDDLTRDLVQE